MQNKKSNNSTPVDQQQKTIVTDDATRKIIADAHTQADKDMEEEAAFTDGNENDDLDEAENLQLDDHTPIE